MDEGEGEAAYGTKEVTKEELKAKKEAESALLAEIFQAGILVSDRKRKAAEQKATIGGLTAELKEEGGKLSQLQRRMKNVQVDIKEREEGTEIIKEELSSISQQVEGYLDHRRAEADAISVEDLSLEAEEQFLAAFERDVQASKKAAEAELRATSKDGEDPEDGEASSKPSLEGLVLLEFQDAQVRLFVPPHYTFSQLHSDGSRYFQVQPSDVCLQV